MDELFHGKSQSKMDDEMGYPYNFGNLHIGKWPMKVIGCRCFAHAFSWPVLHGKLLHCQRGSCFFGTNGSGNARHHWPQILSGQMPAYPAALCCTIKPKFWRPKGWFPHNRNAIRWHKSLVPRSSHHTRRHDVNPCSSTHVIFITM